MTTSWRLIRSGFLGGAENMAVDEALLEAVARGLSGPVLRIYRWSPSTVTLGYSQRGSDVVNLEACRDLGLDVVRRCTGGRAVLHEHEVTYAVISPDRSGIFPGGILGNYKVIAGVLRRTLETFGVETEMAKARSHGSGGEGAQQSACFTAPSSHELLYRGCKMTGSAQKRHGSAFLQHGSIPVDLDLERLFTALDTRRDIAAAAGGRLLGRSIGWLNRWLERPLTVSEVEDRLVAACSECWGIRFIESELSAEEKERAGVLQEGKYADAAWNLQGVG